MKTNNKYKSLFETVKLPNGVELDNRFVLSPMITNSSTKEGYVTEEDIAYAKRRKDSAPLQVTGAAYIEKYGQLFEYGFSIDRDIIQLTHAGRFSKIALQNFGTVYGPSELHLNSPIKHTVQSMSKEKIAEVIEQYAEATRRAIRAGFSGIEISGAQRLLIQTFFSTFSNQREDEYGADNLENRMRFGLEVISAVQKVIKEEAPKDFIFGYRGTPEETRGNEIGYSAEEFLEYIDRVLEIADIDYLATASWGKNIYKQKIRQGKYQGEFMNQVVYDYIAKRTVVMATGGINSPDKALEAIQFADLVGASTPFVTEPEFVTKIKAGKENEIDLGFTEDEVSELAIPDRAFKDMIELMDIGASLSQETRDRLNKLRD